MPWAFGGAAQATGRPKSDKPLALISRRGLPILLDVDTWRGVGTNDQADPLYQLLNETDDSAEIMLRDHDPGRELSVRISRWFEDRSLHPVRE